MMTLEEQKLAICQKLPGLVIYCDEILYWKSPEGKHLNCGLYGHQINWSTEGLQVCHEAERLMKRPNGCMPTAWYVALRIASHDNEECATYEQRLEALCRVWFPEQFNP